MNNLIIALEEVEQTGNKGESFLDIFTSNIAIIVYVALFTLAIIGIAVLFIVNENLTNEKVDKIQNTGNIEYEGANGQKQTAKMSVNKDLNKKNNNERFQKLALLDRQYPKKEHIVSTDGLTLEYICRRFRSFASSIEGNPLYYSIHDIRRWVANMGVSKISILQGMSGTGKTSLPVAWGKFTNNPACIVPVQPMWKERSDLIGYYNEFTGKFNESLILEKLYEANKSNKVFIIVLDEVNIARIEYYFAEFLSLLELPSAEERILEVTTNISKKDPKEFKNGKILLADNVWFVGTANNDDSTFSISDKVYDRSMVLNLDYRCDAFVSDDDKEPIMLSYETLRDLFNKAVKEFALTKRGKSRIAEFDAYLKTTFGITFGNRIRRQIEKYVPIYIGCGGSETEAIDDILSKKILRKLEAQNPVLIKSKAEEIIGKLNDIFGQDMMPVSEGYIRKLASSI